jgi:hypothetical protein
VPKNSPLKNSKKRLFITILRSNDNNKKECNIMINKEKDVEIKIENKEAIESILAKVNGKAKAHTYSKIEQLIELSKEAESRLNSLGLVKSMRKGAQYWAESANSVAKKYRSSRIGTNVTLVRKKDYWALSHVESDTFYPTDGGARRIYVTKKQADYMQEKFAKNYNVLQ